MRRDPSVRPLLRLDHDPVLIVSGCEGATRRYRCLHHAEQLRLRCIPVRVVSQTLHDIEDEGLGHGIVILHRVAWDPTVQALIDRTRGAGGIVLFDIDDLVFEPESTHQHHGVTHLSQEDQVLYHDGVRRYRNTLLACDGAIVPTRFLATRVQALGRPAWASRNCVDLEIARRSERAAETKEDSAVIIGYASGSRTHDRDFGESAGPAVLRIMARRPDVLLHIIGPLDLGAEWDAVRERIVRVPAVDWQALPAEIARFDISLAPLEIDNLFCRGKSELKWLEASACGVPSVAVDTEAFRDAIDDGVTGILAADVDGWEHALDRLIDDPAGRRAMGAAAAAAVLGSRTTEGQAESFERTLREARTTLRPDSVPPPPPTFTAGRPERPLKIAMLVPEPPKGSGGHASIFRMIAALDAAGHQVTVHIKPGPLMQGEREAEAAAFIRTNFPRSGARITLSPEIDACDVAIATSWTTALDVHFAPARTKLYFVQDFEPFFQPLSADYLASESTYRLGLGHITLGPWLSELLEERYEARAVPIDFGVEHHIYSPGPNGALESGTQEKTGPERIVFYGRGSTPRRGVPLGLEALGLVKAARPEVEIVLYGGDSPGLADFPHVHSGILTQEKLTALYRSATVGLALSYTNLSFVPLEMAACGLPVVVVETEPAAWYQVDGTTCHVAEPTAEIVAEGILQVIDDNALRQRLIDGGLERVKELNWDRSRAQFVRHVESYAAADVESGENEHAAQKDDTFSVYSPNTPERAGTPSLQPILDVLDATNHTEPRTKTMSLHDVIEWPLTSGADGLHRIDLRVSVDRAASKGHVVLQLRDEGRADAVLAESMCSAHSLLDGEWNTFEFPLLPESAGRSLIARLTIAADGRAVGVSAASDASDASECRVALVVGNNGIPTYRTFGLEPGSIPAQPSAIHDPELFGRLHHRRRSLAFNRARHARLHGRGGLMAAVDVWRRSTNPLPPGPHRLWPDSASGAGKLARGLFRYGPIRVAREMIALRRWQAGERASSSDAADLSEGAVLSASITGASIVADGYPTALASLGKELVKAASAIPAASTTRPPLLLIDEPALARFAMGDDFLLAERSVSTSAGPIMTLGPWLARWIVARYDAATPIEIPYPVDTSTFSMGRPAGERDPIVTLDLAICDQRSNTVLGLRTLELVAQLVPGARAMVFSSRALGAEPTLDPTAAVAGVTWAGVLDQKARAALLQKAAVLVIPTFTNPPLEAVEAMACGCVIAAPDVISSAWLLKDGLTAMTAPPHADALALSVARVLRDRELRDRIVRGAAKVVAGMSVERAAEAIGEAASTVGSEPCSTTGSMSGSASDERDSAEQDAVSWLALRPAETRASGPLLNALRFAEQRNAALALEVEAIEASAPARAAAWMSLSPRPLPLPEARPWAPDAGLITKLARTFMHYGPAAFVREVRDGVRWRRMSEVERGEATRRG